MPNNSAAQRNMEVFAEAYTEEVARLMAGVDAIIPLHDVVTVTGLSYDQTSMCVWMGEGRKGRKHCDCFQSSM